MTWRKFAPKVTQAEMRLFHALNQKGIRFITQEYIHTKHRDYLIDFLVFPNLVVEVDGASHNLQIRQMKDTIKDQHLHEEGYTVLRVADEEIYKNLNSTVKRIEDLCKPKQSSPH